MEVCLDPACVGFDTPLDEYLAAAGQAGFRLAETPVTWLDGYAGRHGVDALRALLDRYAVTPAQFTCGLGVPGNICVPAEPFEKRLSELPRLAELAAAVGCGRGSLFCDQQRHEGVPVGGTELVDRIARIAAILDARGLGLSVGFIGADLLGRAAQIVAATGTAVRPGILVDTISLAKAELGVGWIAGLPAGAIGWLRVADAPTGRRPADLAYADRLLPGTGRLPLTELVEACRERGYAGPVSVEVGDPALDGLPPGERARRAYAAVRSVVPG